MANNARNVFNCWDEFARFLSGNQTSVTPLQKEERPGVWVESSRQSSSYDNEHISERNTQMDSLSSPLVKSKEESNSMQTRIVMLEETIAGLVTGLVILTSVILVLCTYSVGMVDNWSSNHGKHVVTTAVAIVVMVYSGTVNSAVLSIWKNRSFRRHEQSDSEGPRCLLEPCLMHEEESQRAQPSQEQQIPIVMREQDDIPKASTWPNTPVFLCMNTSASSQLNVPIFGPGPCPIGVPFAFSSELFEGQCLVRLKDVASDDPKGDADYFQGRKRCFQSIVQGRFKANLAVSDVLTGHEFVRPLQHLPHPWLLNAGTTLIGKLAPSVNIHVHTEQPSCMAIMGATSQIVRVDRPGEEPDIRSVDIQENCVELGGVFANGKMKASGRKKFLSHPNRSKDYTFNTDLVYTFDFYQSLFDAGTYSLNLGFINLGLSPVLDGQPIQCLSKTRDGRYLWSFQIWHENLLPKQNLETDEVKLPGNMK
jgi:Protein of unknown function (DUF1769)